jgi:membrane-associated phospholipid phosphatase
VYNRPRPTAVDGSIEAVISNPHSPSYPAEHAVTAGAAAVVLSCLYPDDARQWSELANECARSRLLAGVQFPSDVEAGLALGGSDRRVNPVLPQMATWKPWVLASPSQFRPGPPPAFGSPELAAEMAEVKNVPRGQANGATNTAAFYWNSAAVYRLWGAILDRKILESNLDENAPRAARVYALWAVAISDALIASWDAKYTYWSMRPFQFDPAITPLFPTPNFPGYVSAHATTSAASAAVLGYLAGRRGLFHFTG